MKTPMRNRVKWLLVTLLGMLALPFPTQAFYNPTTGRWLSRDPIGEEGSEHLYNFVDSSPVNHFDVLGLASLDFWSQGKVQYDGPFAWTGQVTRDYSESGVSASASAWFRQVVIEVRGCSGRICNSGGTGDASSFIRARVKNVTRCPITADCECSLHWLVTNFTPGRPGRKPVTVKGTLLGHAFRKTYPARRRPDGSYYAFGAGDFTRKKTVQLAAGATEELYYAFDSNSSAPGIPGAGFTETMSGDCSCSVRK